MYMAAVSEDDVVLWENITDAIQTFASAVAESNNNEVASGLYATVMSCTAFTRETLMCSLYHLTMNKVARLMFVQMSADDKDMWLRTYLATSYYK